MAVSTSLLLGLEDRHDGGRVVFEFERASGREGVEALFTVTSRLR
jgi:hypothetical protein